MAAYKNPGTQEIRKAFTGLRNDIDKELRDMTKELRGVVKEATPVKTGALKKSYSPVKKVSQWRYEIENKADYADQILYKGRTGPGRGSLQLPAGLAPVITEFLDNRG